MKKLLIIMILLVASSVIGCTSQKTSIVANVETKQYREIKIEAYQFGFQPDVINVKKGENIRLIFTSRDVAHGVFITDGIDMATKTFGRGQTEIIEFTANKTGTFNMQCSVYCGDGHPQMKGRIIVSE
jgi:heme/copper-type cytochrome/quinol oxidase subunit 2